MKELEEMRKQVTEAEVKETIEILEREEAKVREKQAKKTEALQTA
jgi:hypothetical protein